MEGERRGQGSSVCVEGGKERTGKGGGVRRGRGGGRRGEVREIKERRKIEGRVER